VKGGRAAAKNMRKHVFGGVGFFFWFPHRQVRPEKTGAPALPGRTNSGGAAGQHFGRNPHPPALLSVRHGLPANPASV